MKILFLGNSITLHGVRPEVGWYNIWGMAASCKERDYVHLIEHDLTEFGKNPVVRYRNIAELESKPECDIPAYFAEELAFAPDILVINLGENTSLETVDQFGEFCSSLITAFKNACRCSVIVVGNFWKNPRCEELQARSAKENGAIYLSLEPIQGKEYQAIGLFEHEGVAAHPSDLGMRAIADIILEEIKKEGL